MNWRKVKSTVQLVKIFQKKKKLLISANRNSMSCFVLLFAVYEQFCKRIALNALVDNLKKKLEKFVRRRTQKQTYENLYKPIRILEGSKLLWIRHEILIFIFKIHLKVYNKEFFFWRSRNQLNKLNETRVEGLQWKLRKLLK